MLAFCRKIFLIPKVKREKFITNRKDQHTVRLKINNNKLKFNKVKISKEIFINKKLINFN